MPPHERIGRATLSRSGGALHPTALALRARRARSAAAQAFAKNGTWDVPTLIRLRTQRFIQDQPYRTDLNLIYAARRRGSLGGTIDDDVAQRRCDVPPVLQSRADPAQAVEAERREDARGLRHRGNSQLGHPWRETGSRCCGTVEPGARLTWSLAVARTTGRADYTRGFKVRLIAPQFVRPYVKGNKNDANDAGAI
jgi:hypothetical protein